MSPLPSDPVEVGEQGRSGNVESGEFCDCAYSVAFFNFDIDI